MGRPSGPASCWYASEVGFIKSSIRIMAKPRNFGTSSRGVPSLLQTQQAIPNSSCVGVLLGPRVLAVQARSLSIGWRFIVSRHEET
jgi:hypothetical protein